MILYRFDDLYPMCFLCGERVLQIVGQDIDLPWNALQEEDKNLELDKIFGMGHAHISCLRNSEWAQLVAKRKRESINRHWRSVFKNGTIAIFDTVLNSISIIRDDGWFVKFASAAERQETDRGMSVAVTTIYDVNAKWSDLMSTLYKELSATDKDNPYSFLVFIDAFNVKEKLIDYEAVSNGKIYSQPIIVFDEDGVPHEKDPASGNLKVKAEYYVYIPDDIWKLIPSKLLT